MSLKNADVGQLVSWMNDIVMELARRASLPPPPAEPMPPWATAAMMAPKPPIPPAEPVQVQAPQLMGGVKMTARTDPALARSFMAVPVRQEGIPGLNGNGKGDGAIDLGVRGI